MFNSSDIAHAATIVTPEDLEKGTALAEDEVIVKSPEAPEKEEALNLTPEKPE